MPHTCNHKRNQEKKAIGVLSARRRVFLCVCLLLGVQALLLVATVAARSLPGLHPMGRQTLFRLLLAFAVGGVLLAILCICVAFFIARVVSTPLTSLVAQVQQARKTGPIVLQRTGIREMDALAAAIETLSTEVYRSACRFTEIIELSATHMGGFQLNTEENTVFVNRNFFSLFGMPQLQAAEMSCQEFIAALRQLEPYVVQQTPGDVPAKTECLLKLPQPVPGQTVWVCLRLLRQGPLWVGFAQDVTHQQQQLALLAYERDHDMLTGLYNLRAFQRNVQEVLAQKQDTPRCAALLMTDVDNLKFINDTYGHEAGDEALRLTAGILATHADDHTLLARMAGDEFLAFYYGFASRELLQHRLTTLQSAFRAAAVPLPACPGHPLRVSGGIAWCPQDGETFDVLKRCADFAMYQVKRTTKGEFASFDADSYRRDSFLLRGTEALNQMLEQHRVAYHFQPIVNARTGEVFAYEALMRPLVEPLASPDAVLRLARQECKLARLEQLTWFCALEAFALHCENGAIAPTCKLFVNSLANQALPESDQALLEERFGPLLNRIVQERVEEERTDDVCEQKKAAYLARWGCQTALDDYGSGYNGEKNLLSYLPDYIKLDRCLISGIHADTGKQHLVASVTALAHARGSAVVAEGVETSAELQTLIALQTDFLQGYYLAKPAALPPLPPPARIAEILHANGVQ